MADALSLRYATTAIQQINGYLAVVVGGDLVQLAAAMELRREINKLAANPGLGSTRLGGPFETRRIHRFRLEADRQTRLAHVVYRVTPEGTLDILSFSAVPV